MIADRIRSIQAVSGGGGGSPLTALVTSPPVTISRNNFTGCVGFRFRSRVTQTIYAVGRSVGSPFSQSHTVKIWTDTGIELASAAISSASEVLDGYAVQAISPITLTAGIYYRIASSEFSGGDTWADMQIVPHATANIDSLRPVYVGGTDIFPAIVTPNDGRGYVFCNLYTKDSLILNMQGTAGDSLILNMQGTAGTAVFTDESPNALTVTPYGDAQLVSDATFGTVASFDGSGDYLSLGTQSQLDFGTGDFTVECWFQLTSTTNADQGILNDTRATFGTGSVLFKARQASGSGKICFQAYDFSSVGGRIVQSTTVPAVNTWYHVAFVRSSGSVRLFVNGVLESSGTWAGSVNFNYNNGTRIGHSILDGANGHFTGRIGPLRITPGVARYTANFTPPTGLFPTS